MNSMGKLFICGTPIGNMKDITLRALEILESVDFIAAEDTRCTLKLLNHYEIKNKLISYHEHNKKKSGDEIINLLLSGKNIALVTDAGMPCISDPGSDLVKLCHENEIEVTVVPGPSACISALAMTGINFKRFVFEGFLPRNKKEITKILKRLENEEGVTIFYESPYRVLDTLNFIQEIVGSERCVHLIREITKIYEEIRSGSIGEIIEQVAAIEQLKGEYVIVVEGISEEEKNKRNAKLWSEISIKEHVENYIAKGLNQKEAIKCVACDRNLPKKEIYSVFHEL